MATLFFKRLYPDASVLAFEPDKQAFAVLEDNLTQNGMNNVKVENAAVYSREGVVTLYSDPYQAGSVYTSTHKSMLESLTDPNQSSVRAVSLSSFIDKEVDFLKIDVEGAEHEILEDLDRSKKIAFVREMVIEYHHHVGDEKDRLSSLLHVLEANNFGYQITSQDLFVGKQAYQSLFNSAYSHTR